MSAHDPSQKVNSASQPVSPSDTNSDTLDSLDHAMPIKSDKDGPMYSVQRSGSNDNEATGRIEPRAHPWQPSYLRIAPLCGIGALLLAVLQIVSNQMGGGVSVATW